MKKNLFRIFRFLLFLLVLFILFVGFHLILGSINDYQPNEETTLDIQHVAKNIIEKDTLEIISWNIGFAGIGHKDYMFYDRGKTLTSGSSLVTPPKDNVLESLTGITDFVRTNPADFFLFQEVDINSKRSHFTNQYDSIQSVLSEYSSHVALNFNVARVPIPILEPWNIMGKIESGLSSFSTYNITEAKRYQLPGNFSWPKRIFHLDRCLSVQQIKTQYEHDLFVINLHNSAYDADGFMKNLQLNYLKALILPLYEAGHYVIVGGDWNMSPPGLNIDQVYVTGIPGQSLIQTTPNFMPKGWTWSFDNRFTTSRKSDMPYALGSSNEKLIDFFLVSPNVEVLHMETRKQNFRHSDHEPIYLKCLLQPNNSIQ